MLAEMIIKLSNKIIKFRKLKVPAENLLVLAPHCLQKKECQQDVHSDINNCKSCGQCKCENLLDLSKRTGVKVVVAQGGREAIKAVKNPKVKAVIAIACEAELKAGIMAVFPKPVLAIHNSLPNGACRSTDVDFQKVEAAVKQLIRE